MAVPISSFLFWNNIYCEEMKWPGEWGKLERLSQCVHVTTLCGGFPSYISSMKSYMIKTTFWIRTPSLYYMILWVKDLEVMMRQSSLSNLAFLLCLRCVLRL